MSRTKEKEFVMFDTRKRVMGKVKKISIWLSKGHVETLDKDARKAGMNRSAYLRYYLKYLYESPTNLI